MTDVAVTDWAEDAPARLSPAARFELGREARRRVPRSAHREWAVTSDRPDPVSLLEEQNANRLPWLVPVRHSRMRVSPLAFFRGTARIMAADLAATPVADLAVQLGGDAHLSNFGAYASPSRQLVFDANDFDETLPGPFEWDLKRLATSFMVAAQHCGFDLPTARQVTATSGKAYRRAMAGYAQAGYLDLWYQKFTPDEILAAGGMNADELAVRLKRFERRARSRTSLQALKKLTEEIDGRFRIRSAPPLLVPLRDLPPEYDAAALETAVRVGFERYKDTLSDHHHTLLDRYNPVDIAVKVVGVGSVGTRCLIMLLAGRDDNDPLFLQIKEAGRSVLEEHLPPSRYRNRGRRVVEGQRLTQAESDILLGWSQGLEDRHYYVRQLRDWKGSVEVDGATVKQMGFYAGLCGRTLACGHARSGDPTAIAAYLGRGDAMDTAVTDFAEAYAKQNLSDYNHFLDAIEDGRLETLDVERIRR